MYSTANLRPRGLWYDTLRNMLFWPNLMAISRSTTLRRGTRVEIRPSWQMSVERCLADIDDEDFSPTISHTVRTSMILAYTPDAAIGGQKLEVTMGSFFPHGQRELITEITLDAGATYELYVQGPR